MNQSWVKWIQASVIKYLDTDSPIQIFYEGEHQDSKELAEYAECRTLGPKFREMSRGNWRIDFRLNMLIYVARGSSNVYRIHELGGIFAAKYANIPVYKLGTGDGDDKTLAFCLRPTETINYVYTGESDQDSGVVNAVVDGNFRVEIQE